MTGGVWPQVVDSDGYCRIIREAATYPATERSYENAKERIQAIAT